MVGVVNERFLQYIPARFDKYLDTTKFGPGLGSPIRDDRQSPVGACKTMDGNGTAFAACHQPDRLGALNWPMGKTLISPPFRAGHLPLVGTLQTFDAALLYRKL